MAAEFSSNALQSVASNASVIFTESPVPCNKGLVYHRDESGIFRLASPSTIGYRSCFCNGMPMAIYEVGFHANIQIPTGGTVEAISLAITIDGETDPSSIMTITPAATAELGNVGADILVAVPSICKCSSVSVKNVSEQAVEVQNANLVIDYLGIRR